MTEMLERSSREDKDIESMLVRLKSASGKSRSNHLTFDISDIDQNVFEDAETSTIGKKKRSVKRKRTPKPNVEVKKMKPMEDMVVSSDTDSCSDAESGML